MNTTTPFATNPLSLLSDFTNSDEARKIRAELQERNLTIPLGECDGVSYIFCGNGFCENGENGGRPLASFHAIIEAFESEGSEAPKEKRSAESIVPFIREACARLTRA